MSASYRPIAETAPSQSANSYIYALKPTFGHGLAAITSADELIVLDRQNLAAGCKLRFDDTPRGVNCLEPLDETGQSLVCSGQDGTIVVYDLRTQRRVGQFQIGERCSIHELVFGG